MPALTEVKLSISSPAFSHGSDIPDKYSKEGDDINPPLEIESLPKGTLSLAIITEDPDASKGTFVHWVVWNIEPKATIEENHMPGITGRNGSGKTGYTGPNPPDGEHRYFFKVYALNTMVDIPAGSDKDMLLHAMERHVIGYGEIMGRYTKKNANNN